MNEQLSDYIDYLVDGIESMLVTPNGCIGVEPEFRIMPLGHDSPTQD